MTAMRPSPERDRLLELLADRASGALGPAEQRELAELLARSPRPTDDSGRVIVPEEFSALPGLVAGAWATRGPALPEGLRARMLEVGVDEVLGNAGQATPRGPLPIQRTAPAPRRLIGPAGWAGWLAAAAAVAFAVLSLPATPTPAPPTAIPAAWEQRANLLATSTDTTVVAFAALQDPAAQGVSGDVAWNQALQKGFLRFRGLPENDPSREQYQLWIFDDGRPDGGEFPVDGGVFDISAMSRDPATGDLVVPINAKLPVIRPAAFAVTIERAGGVVVTKRERLLLLAQKP